MSVFRRIIYHSGWFILLGPLIGAATAIGVINYSPAIIGGPDSFLFCFYRTIPALVIITGWIYSLLPAWLTGVACALIPLKLYQKIINRMILCACSGSQKARTRSKKDATPCCVASYVNYWPECSDLGYG